MFLERIFFLYSQVQRSQVSPLSEARKKLNRLQRVEVDSVSLSQSDYCPLKHIRTPVIPIKALNITKEIKKVWIPLPYPPNMFSLVCSYCYLLSTSCLFGFTLGIYQECYPSVAITTFCWVTAMSTFLFPLLIFSMMGFFFPWHLLRWFYSQGIIFFSSKT